MPDQELHLEIRQIEPGDKLTGLSLGDPKFTALKTFLQRHAKAYQEQNLGRTYAVFLVVEAKAKVVAYVTLVCGEVVIGDDDDRLLADVDYGYRHYPAVKIARLAVDAKMRGLNVGRRLVDLALGTAKGIICPAVGCRFVVVDAKQEAVAFYQRCGFTLLDTEANRRRSEPVMFVDLQKT